MGLRFNSSLAIYEIKIIRYSIYRSNICKVILAPANSSMKETRPQVQENIQNISDIPDLDQNLLKIEILCKDTEILESPVEGKRLSVPDYFLPHNNTSVMFPVTISWHHIFPGHTTHCENVSCHTKLNIAQVPAQTGLTWNYSIETGLSPPPLPKCNQ